MAIQFTIPFETLVTLVEQLPREQQQELIQRLLRKATDDQPKLSAAEKIALFESAQLNVKVNREISMRREDWYGDDER